jgi:hypothetical protein
VKTKDDLDEHVQIPVLPDEDVQLQLLTHNDTTVPQLHNTPNICNYNSPPMLCPDVITYTKLRLFMQYGRHRGNPESSKFIAIDIS